MSFEEINGERVDQATAVSHESRNLALFDFFIGRYKETEVTFEEVLNYLNKRIKASGGSFTVELNADIIKNLSPDPETEIRSILTTRTQTGYTIIGVQDVVYDLSRDAHLGSYNTKGKIVLVPNKYFAIDSFFRTIAPFAPENKASYPTRTDFGSLLKLIRRNAEQGWNERIIRFEISKTLNADILTAPVVFNQRPILYKDVIDVICSELDINYQLEDEDTIVFVPSKASE